METHKNYQGWTVPELITKQNDLIEKMILTLDNIQSYNLLALESLTLIIQILRDIEKK